MAPRKTILRELSKAGAGSGAVYARPSTIPGFSDAPDKYQKAVNELLQARLLEGRKDDQGHMTIAINEARRREVEKEIKPVWARPSVWAAIVLIVAAVGAFVTI